MTRKLVWGLASAAQKARYLLSGSVLIGDPQEAAGYGEWFLYRSVPFSSAWSVVGLRFSGRHGAHPVHCHRVSTGGSSGIIVQSLKVKDIEKGTIRIDGSMNHYNANDICVYTSNLNTSLSRSSAIETYFTTHVCIWPRQWSFNVAPNCWDTGVTLREMLKWSPFSLC